MTNRQIQAVLFDLDGTLIATRQLYIAAYANALQPHVGKLLTDAEIMALTPRAEVEFTAAQVSPSHAHACLERFYANYEALHGTHFRGVYSGILELLKTLRGKQIGIGVVTSKSRRAWQISAQFAPLPEMDVCIFSDDVRCLKPAPEGIERARAALSVPAEQILYVGDSLSDLQAATAAAVVPGAALWSKRPNERDAFRQSAEQSGGPVFLEPSDIGSWISSSQSPLP